MTLAMAEQARSIQENFEAAVTLARTDLYYHDPNFRYRVQLAADAMVIEGEPLNMDVWRGYIDKAIRVIVALEWGEEWVTSSH